MTAQKLKNMGEQIDTRDVEPAQIFHSWRVNLVSGLHQPVPDVAADLRQPPLILSPSISRPCVGIFLTKTTLNKLPSIKYALWTSGSVFCIHKMQKYFVCVVLNLLMVNINVFLRTTKRMESYSQNSNKIRFSARSRDIKQHMAHYRFGFGGNRRGWHRGAKVSRNYGNKI